MATVLPDNPAAQLEFFTAHAPIWSAEGGSIGLSLEQTGAVADATALAAEAFRAAEAARLAALAATQRWHLAAERMRAAGGIAVQAIKIHAKTTGDLDVFARAHVPVPEKTGPGSRTQDEKNAALPHIRSCTASPLAFGRTVVEWTCGIGATKGAGAGMSYRVQRSLDGGRMQLINVVGSPGPGRRSNRFVDDTIPARTGTVAYHITPMRGGAIGTVGPLVSVQFGSTACEAAATARLAA